MTHPIETRIDNALSNLRALELSDALTSDTPVVSEIYLSWDTTGGSVTLDMVSTPGHLGRFTATVTGTPGWLTFNIVLGEASLRAGDVIGLVARLDNPRGIPLPAFVRTSRDGHSGDTEMTNPLGGEGRGPVQTMLHTIEPHEFIGLGNGFHTLIFRLPTENFTLGLQDMRLFILPAAEGLRSSADTLASLTG